MDNQLPLTPHIDFFGPFQFGDGEEPPQAEKMIHFYSPDAEGDVWHFPDYLLNLLNQWLDSKLFYLEALVRLFFYTSRPDNFLRRKCNWHST